LKPLPKKELRLRISMLSLGLALWFCISLPGQTQSDPPHAILKKLIPPEYPAMAGIAGISGDVILTVSIHPDGSIESIKSRSGHPLLMQGVIESARQSQFECSGCTDTADITLRYSFQPPITKADRCCCSSGASVPQPVPPSVDISPSEVHVTITALPVCICPDACTMEEAVAQSHFRSAKCLYLWKCGRHRVIVQ
jgi:TonB family protein